jgi:hypothetical protein
MKKIPFLQAYDKDQLLEMASIVNYKYVA